MPVRRVSIVQDGADWLGEFPDNNVTEIILLVTWYILTSVFYFFFQHVCLTFKKTYKQMFGKMALENLIAGKMKRENYDGR